jgi:hypothetical protein
MSKEFKEGFVNTGKVLSEMDKAMLADFRMIKPIVDAFVRILSHNEAQMVAYLQAKYELGGTYHEITPDGEILKQVGMEPKSGSPNIKLH